MANKLIDLAGLGYFFDKLKKKYLSPALLNGELNFEYLLTQYYWCPNRPPYDTYQGQPTEPQGIAYLGSNKIVMNVCAYRSHSVPGNTSGGSPLLTDNTEFKIFSGVNQPQYITVDSTYQTAGLGHANCLTYNPDKNRLYVAVHSYSTISSGSGASAVYEGHNSKQVKVIDPSDYTVKQTLNINTATVESQIQSRYSKTVTIDSIGFVAYDKIGKKLYGWVDDFYLIEIPLPSSDTGTVSVTASLVTRIAKPQTIGGGQQGFAVMDDLVFLVKEYPNLVWVYSISQDKVVRCYSVPDYDCFGHKIRYLEGIDYDPVTKDFYISSFVVTNYWKRREGQYLRACYVHRFNPFTDSPGSFNAFGYYDDANQQYVYKGFYDTAANSVLNLSVNKWSHPSVKPHQRGYDKYPFGTISEAITALQSGKFPQAYFIYMLNSGLYDEYLTIRNLDLIFNGEAFTVHGMDIQNSHVHFNSKVTLDGANVTNMAPLYINNSKVAFTGYSITVPQDFESSVGLTNRTCLYSSGSEVENNDGSDYEYNGNSYTNNDIVLFRSRIKSQSAANTSSTAKAIRLNNSDWENGYPPEAYSVNLFGSNKGQFTASKLVSNDGAAPMGNVQAVVMIKYNSEEHFFTSGVRYKGTTSLNLFTHTPHGVVKTVLNADGTVASTAFEGTQPSAVTEFDTKFIRYV